ncbi:MAG: DUF882 domain-containing protein [Janthinobacterium lividum]
MTFTTPKISFFHRTAVLAAVSFGFCTALRADEVPRMPTIPASHTAHLGMLDTLRLKMHHLHTGESIDVAYKQGGQYSNMGVAMLNQFLRDHRTDQKADYDPREFDLLHALLNKLHKPGATIDIVCGFRTPQSNQFLRTRSAETGVAEHSQHILSKAIDIRIPGVSTRALRDAALSLGMGGVGYYPRSGFVHVDVGPVRQWQFGAPAPRQYASRGGHGHRRRHSA